MIFVVLQQLSKISDQHKPSLAVLKEQEWTHGVESAVDVALLGRFYERFADHAVEIGRRVIFQATGEISDA